MANFQFFHDFIYMNGSAKSSGTAMDRPHGWFIFEGLNFTNDQHSHTPEKPAILYLYAFI